MGTTRIYTGPMPVLYLVCRMGWTLCRKYLTNFSAYKSLYTPAYIDQQLQAIDYAAAIDDNQNRNAGGNNLRIDAEDATRLVCHNWQALKTYIEQAFKGAKLDNTLAIAGADSYAKTFVFNWAETQLLISSANQFITDNLAVLLSDGYMPDAFAARFAADGKDCVHKCNTYIINNSHKHNVTIDKLTANNAVYRSAISMFKDGRQVFRGTEVVRNQFSYSSLAVLAAGNGAGSLRGKVTDPQTGKPLAGVTVTFINSSRVHTTNKRGAYKMARLAAGTYKIEFSKENYEPQTIVVSIDTATMATCNADLNPAMAVIAAAEQLQVA